MTKNGKILLGTTLTLATISFCSASFVSGDGFLAAWLAITSLLTGLGCAAAAVGCLIDILLENEE